MKSFGMVVVVLLCAAGAALAWWLQQTPSAATEPAPKRATHAKPAAPQSPTAPAQTKAPTPAEAAPEALAQAVTIRGVVQTADGDPVKDASVQLSMRDDFMPDDPSLTEGELGKHLQLPGKVSTDESGAYTLQVASDGPPLMMASLACDAPGFARNVKPLHPLIEGDTPSDLRVDFIVERGARIFGVVTNADSGAPVPDAMVKISPQRKYGRGFGFDESATGYQTRAGADGAYEISVPPGTYHASAFTEDLALLYVAEAVPTVTLSTGQERQLDIPLAAAAVVQGTIRAPEGRTLLEEELDVEAEPQQEQDDLFENGISYDDGTFVHTDKELLADGSMHYQLRGLKMAKPYKVTVTQRGIAPFASEPFTVQPGQSPYTLDITLSMGSTLRGTVSYEDGSLAIETAIELDRALGPSLSPVRGEFSGDPLKTDAAGKFEIAGVEAGSYVIKRQGDWMRDVRAGIQPHKDDLIAVDGAHDVNDLQVVLPGERPGPAGSVSGHVVDSAGAPVAGAMVSLIDMTRFVEPIKTDADGAFKFDGLTGEDFTLSASKGHQTGSQGEVKVGDDVTITLIEQCKVSGTVTDAAGNPVPRCSVTLKQPGSEVGGSRFFADRIDYNGTGKTNDAGGFEFSNVSPGHYFVHAKSEDAGTGDSEAFELGQAESKLGVSVVLKPGTRFGGQVVSGKGQPVVGARVTLRMMPPEDDLLATHQLDLPDELSPPDYEVHTGDDGKFEMRSVEQGKYLIVASAEGYASKREKDLAITAGHDYLGYRAVLGQGGCIVGTAQSGGKVKKGLQVTAMGEGLGQKMVRAGDDGHFELCGLAPGTYQVSVFDMEEMRSGGLAFSTPRMKSVEVKENETTEVDFAPPADAGNVSGTISGVSGMASIVVRPPSAAPAGMEAFGGMMGGDGAGGFAMAQQDGPFSIAEVTAGEYLIEVYVMPKIGPGFDPTALINSPPKAVVQQKITVTAGETTTVELNLPVAENAGGEPATP